MFFIVYVYQAPLVVPTVSADIDGMAAQLKAVEDPPLFFFASGGVSSLLFGWMLQSMKYYIIINLRMVSRHFIYSFFGYDFNLLG